MVTNVNYVTTVSALPLGRRDAVDIVTVTSANSTSWVTVTYSSTEMSILYQTLKVDATYTSSGTTASGTKESSASLTTSANAKTTTATKSGSGRGLVVDVSLMMVMAFTLVGVCNI